ncbi:hypothetical protein J5X84_15560 [Streptosporangiaceae bacterium NEAU-GS5]|nr:hypothetical protein [Streptosporangiaceae bacterium NEAU-GS5]
MASPEPLRQPRRPPTATLRPAREIPLESDELDEFRWAVARVFNDQTSAENLLARIGYPREHLPTWAGQNADTWWTEVFLALHHGIIDLPHRRLLGAAVRVYQHNPVFRPLAQRHGLINLDEGTAGEQDMTDPVAPEPQAPSMPEVHPDEPEDASADSTAEAVGAPEEAGLADAEEAGPPTCHVIIRASSEDARVEAADILRALELDPRDVWSTAHAISYRLNTDDISHVRRQLDSTDLGWTVVPAGARDYLLREVYVQGPDGRRFRFLDAPAQQTVGNIAAEVVDQYGKTFADKARPTVVDHVEDDGRRRRLAPEATLHDEGVREGAHLRVGFEATAGAINPLDRQDALSRVRNELLSFARSRPDLVVRGFPPMLPTEYELEFTQPSLGPPRTQDGDPTRVERHVVSISLRGDFPQTPPVVFWDSLIFHPNVYPNYGDMSLDHPEHSGLVCLGMLAESYRPSLDFGDLFQLLIDMAAFRNYGLLEPTGVVGADGREETRVNFYDRAAAIWVAEHPEEILQMGGSPGGRPMRVEPEYRNVIEAVT